MNQLTFILAVRLSRKKLNNLNKISGNPVCIILYFSPPCQILSKLYIITDVSKFQVTLFLFASEWAIFSYIIGNDVCSKGCSETVLCFREDAIVFKVNALSLVINFSNIFPGTSSKEIRHFLMGLVLILSAFGINFISACVN